MGGVLHGAHSQVYEFLVEGNLWLCEIGQVGHHQQVLEEKEAMMSEELSGRGAERLVLASSTMDTECENSLR